jgi:hypothetical protein
MKPLKTLSMIYITPVKDSFEKIPEYVEKVKKINNPSAWYTKYGYTVVQLENKALFSTFSEKEKFINKLKNYAEKN